LETKAVFVAVSFGFQYRIILPADTAECHQSKEVCKADPWALQGKSCNKDTPQKVTLDLPLEKVEWPNSLSS